MTIGAGIALLVIGAILAFGVSADFSGISLFAIGIILMIGGAAGIAFALVMQQRRREVIEERRLPREEVIEERRPPRDEVVEERRRRPPEDPPPR
jgi:uncharacterized membrane protein YdfJ with MMPL/SSD domain